MAQRGIEYGKACIIYLIHYYCLYLYLLTCYLFTKSYKEFVAKQMNISSRKGLYKETPLYHIPTVVTGLRTGYR